MGILARPLGQPDRPRTPGGDLESGLQIGREINVRGYSTGVERAEAGCSASEIAAITGHKTLAEVERYTRAADQERLARQAIERQSKNKSGKPELDEVANTIDELTEINSLMNQMALPTGAYGTNQKSPSNLHNCAVLPRRLIPPTYTTIKLMLSHRGWKCVQNLPPADGLDEG